MSDNTKIEWTDATWNPVTGCSVVSAGCKHCYAMKLAGTRMKHHPSREGLTVDTQAGPVWNGIVRFNADWLEQPLRWRKPRRIFVCAHGDLFHDSVPDEWIDKVFAVMALCPQHTFQVLTKRPERMWIYLSNKARCTFKWAYRASEILGSGAEAAKREPKKWPLPNVWLGVSVEHQEAADERIPLLLQTPAAVRFLSCEPLLGPIDLRRWAELGDPDSDMGLSNPGIDWVIVGGESGKGARPMHPDWARSLRDQCQTAGVPFFFKQWGAWAPNCLCHTEQPHQTIKRPEPGKPGVMFHCGKKRAGRLLDGREWNQLPAQFEAMEKENAHMS